MELLAPAGNLDCGLAAFRYGADAVYLGLRRFSARADAENFSLEDLQVLTGLAHRDAAHPRKVYVAVNTLAYDREINDLIDDLATVCTLGVDALIIQDWGVYSLVRRYFPAQTLHASTQMVIHNRQGVEAAARLGFARVIAARELTLPEIAEMAAVPNMELEVFVHGALCYAYSGICLLSSVLRQASGNRGECTYVCRNSCQVENGARRLAQHCNLMSMKDLALGDILPQLAQAGVTSLKIEGRKKTPLYVSAVTDYYRRLLDGTLSPEERLACEERIKTIFSRPWTKFHLANRKAPGVTDTKTVGHRGVPVGTVSALVPGADGEPDRLRFTLENHALEKHDGLQVEPPGQDRPFGFPVDSLYTFRQGNFEEGTSTCQAAPGLTVEVPLPEIHPPITAGMTVFCSSSQEVKRTYDWPSARPALDKKRHPVAFRLEILPEQIQVKVKVAGQEITSITSAPAPFSPARSPEGTENAARNAFQRLGDSEFILDGLEVVNKQGVFVPSSLLNEARRQAVAQAEQALGRWQADLTERARQELRSWKPEGTLSSATRWQVKIDRPYYLNVLSAADCQQLEEVIFDLGRTTAQDLPGALETLAAKVGREKLRLSLPTIIRPGQIQDWFDVASTLFEDGWQRWQVSNPGAWKFLRGLDADSNKLDLTADWQFYASNPAAARALLQELGFRSLTLMPDDEPDNTRRLAALLGDLAAVLLYQDTPLAISDVCANASLKGSCPGKAACDFRQFSLTLRNGDKLQVVNDNCQSVYLAESPLDRRQEWRDLYQAGARIFRLDFLWRDYAPVAVQRILATVMTGESRHDW